MLSQISASSVRPLGAHPVADFVTFQDEGFGKCPTAPRPARRRECRLELCQALLLQHRYTYVFTTDGIGSTHGDITADCVCQVVRCANRERSARALAILHEWVKTTGAEMNEARLRMTRIPKGVDLILNKVSGAPGFWIGNVIVMAGVPSIMQAMLDEMAPKLKIGVPLLLTVRGCARRRHWYAGRRGRQGQSCGRNRQHSVLQSAATGM
jgi:probable molybdopterin binding protein